MGVSGGGPYAAVCAHTIPHRITNAAIVVGLGPAYIPGLLDGTPALVRLGWKHYADFSAFRLFPAILHCLNALFGPSLGIHRLIHGAKSDRKLYADVRLCFIIHQSYKEAFIRGYKGVANDLKLYTSPWGFDVKNIRSKVDLFYGEKDKNVSLTMGKYYASQIQNNTFIIYPDEEHLVSHTHAKDILMALISQCLLHVVILLI